jgi:iron complex outermembrane receptor protein
MDNFSQRPAPMGMQQRATFADATTNGFDASLSLPSFGGILSLGLDGEVSEHDVTITNPNNANFFVTPFPKIEMDRFGGFAEWTGQVSGVNAELGLRIDRNRYEAGEAVTGPALPMGPRNLAMAFNNNRVETSGDETLVDAVARVWTTPVNGISWRATLAHKQQMPGYIQRFGWLPINASGGLADGNIYVGDLTLEPETALIAEAGFDYANRKAYLRPTVFVRQIDDYIQGAPFDATVGVIDSPVEMIASMNGDPTPLRWANVDARLFGVDLDAGYDFDGPLRVDGVLNLVRGERRDIDDNLYRVSPPNLTVGLTWESDVWSATFEARVVAEQNNISSTNSELETDSYSVFSLFGDWQVRDGVRVSAGVENLFDEVYRDHLSGYNRNGFGDVPVGERVPGAGRSLFFRISAAR